MSRHDPLAGTLSRLRFFICDRSCVLTFHELLILEVGLQIWTQKIGEHLGQRFQRNGLGGDGSGGAGGCAGSGAADGGGGDWFRSGCCGRCSVRADRNQWAIFLFQMLIYCNTNGRLVGQ